MGDIPDEDILNNIRSVDESVGGGVTVAEYRERGEYSGRLIQNRFGSWNEAKKEAGAELNYPHRVPGTKTVAEKKRMVAQIKKAVGCRRCGYDDYSVSLEFHHVHGEKSNSIGRMVNGSYSWESVCAELRKCIVLCANCHAAVTNCHANLSE